MYFNLDLHKPSPIMHTQNSPLVLNLGYQLEHKGAEVNVVEHEGGHEVPEETLKTALQTLLNHP